MSKEKPSKKSNLKKYIVRICHKLCQNKADRRQIILGKTNNKKREYAEYEILLE